MERANEARAEIDRCWAGSVVQMVDVIFAQAADVAGPSRGRRVSSLANPEAAAVRGERVEEELELDRSCGKAQVTEGEESQNAREIYLR